MCFLILDELDLLVGGSGGAAVLDTIYKWASNPKMSFSLVGISNSIQDAQQVRRCEERSDELGVRY